MGVAEGLVIALIVAGLAVCGFLVFALVEAVKTLRSMRVLSDDMGQRIPPLIDKIDVTVDALNAEMLRVDAIIDDFEQISSRVSNTVSTVQDAVSAPANAVSSAGERIRVAWNRARHARTASSPAPEDH
ncbi:MAG: hypothetical protein RBS78_03940 [Coriobacteriia bacterium]|nr:hypothetical protein [Coriobacteriia bacterium]